MGHPGPRVSHGYRRNSWADTRDRDPFILAPCGLGDDIRVDLLRNRRRRPRGPAPARANRAVLTRAIGGAYRSLRHDQALCTYCRRPYIPCFPAIGPSQRTPFVRPAAHRCPLQARVGPPRLPQVGCDPALHVVASCPLPVGPCAGAYRCQRFRGAGACGARPATACGALSGSPGRASSSAAGPELVHGRQGRLWGARHDGSPPRPEERARQGRALPAPFQKARP